jgi:hypothetical protein
MNMRVYDVSVRDGLLFRFSSTSVSMTSLPCGGGKPLRERAAVNQRFDTQ